jgi:indole-3-glycerol phosphate synthase
VAESGIANEQDIAAVAVSGYRLALVGSALMRDGDPANTAAAFVAAGRSAAVRASCL